MAEVIVLGDSQFDQTMQYPTKFEEDLAAFKSVYRDAITSRVRCVIHTGDLLERNDRILASVYSRVFDVIRWAENSGVPTIILAGNHDLKVMNSCEMNAIHPFGDPVIEGEVFDLKSGRSKVIWGTSIIDFDYTEIMCVPYYKDENDLMRSTEAMSIFKPCVLVGHFSAYKTDIRYSVFDRVILGHEHKFSLLKDNVMHLGAFCEHSFADEGCGPGRYALLHLPEHGHDSVTVEVHNNTVSRNFKTIKVETAEQYEEFLEEEARGEYDSFYVRPSASRFEDNLKEKKLLDSTIRTDISYLIDKYVSDNNKGSFNPEGLKAIGNSIVGRCR